MASLRALAHCFRGDENEAALFTVSRKQREMFVFHSLLCPSVLPAPAHGVVLLTGRMYSPPPGNLLSKCPLRHTPECTSVFQSGRLRGAAITSLML